ncbi:MAG: tRNA (adenosine(37)-N6)-dimethylallyltransferase MiaA [Candidatus Shapirobacteria bacterium]|nr:tRNA (adenosine(37)-N6)-dimethylallyltransferase MiaA [Candidatus Shapirobacteria bacterium]
MNKLLVVCGPTAMGKTALAIELAKKFTGELVNADSRQIYRGMDIGTGKDLPVNSKFKTQNSKLGIKKERYQIGYYLVSGVPIWLLDVVWPDYRFSVADYIRVATPVIRAIWQRKKLPILVGGTGFYLKGLLEGVDTIGITPDWPFRKKLEGLTVDRLQKRAQKVNPNRFNRMNYSDRHNPRRLIRVIEVAHPRQDGEKFGEGGGLVLDKEQVFWLGLTAAIGKLDQKISQRVKKRLEMGLGAEIEELLKRFSFDNSVLGETIGYRQWQEYFQTPPNQKDQVLDDVVDGWKRAERQYARRQLTWFKKNKQVNWFSIEKKGWLSAVVKAVDQWYIKK